MGNQAKGEKAKGSDEMNPFEPDLLVGNKELTEDLRCPICLLILQDPHDCKACETSFCLRCITTWHSRQDGTCPQCKKMAGITRSHKIVRNLLSSLVFQCPNHLKGCTAKLSYEKLKEHKCDIFCPQCGLAFAADQHSCVALLKERIKALQSHPEESKEMQAKEDILDSVLNSLYKNLFIIQRASRLCENGHRLALIRRPLSTFICDSCHKTLTNSEYVWSCCKCDCDICISCQPLDFKEWRDFSGPELVWQLVKRQELYLVTKLPESCISCNGTLSLEHNPYGHFPAACNWCKKLCKGYVWHCRHCHGRYDVCLDCRPLEVFSNSITRPEFAGALLKQYLSDDRNQDD